MSPDSVDGQVCYLLAWPYEARTAPASPQAIQPLRDAPYFTPIDVDVALLSRESIDIGGVTVTIRRTVYDGSVETAECLYTVTDMLSLDALQAKAHIQSELKKRLLTDQPGVGDMVEEYTVLMAARVSGTPDEFLDRNGQALARFIRSQREVFGPREIEDILISRVRYSGTELTVVDWEGAVIISDEGDFQSDIELMKIGNYQLLRYRLLDQIIERNLETVSQHLHEGARMSWLPNRSKRILRQVIEQRLALMLDFEKINQSLLLIGDWYTAKLYRVIYDEFYLDEWATAIKSRLENLESIVQVMQENFQFSWSRFLEMVQIAGWLLLLIGYFVLFFLEARAVK
jgi:hypothetical protein